MAITFTKLNTKYDSGFFERDSSTWGVSLSNVDYFLVRSSNFALQGFYSGKSTFIDWQQITNPGAPPSNLGTRKTILKGINSEARADDTYMVEVLVYVDATDVPGTPDSVIAFYAPEIEDVPGADVELVNHTFTTVGAATGNWQPIRLTYKIKNGIPTPEINVVVTTVDDPVFNFGASGTIQAGSVYFDLANLYRVTSDSVAPTPIYDKVYFSKNNIVHTVNAGANQTADNYALVSQTLHPSTNTKVNARLTPNTEGKVHFRVNAIADSILTVNAPTNQTDIVELTDRIGQFLLRSGEVYGQITNPIFNTDQTILVVKGGLSTIDFIDNDFFADTKQFLTHAPTTQIVDIQQEHYLYFLVLDPIYQIQLNAFITYEDGSTTEQVLLSTSPTNITVATPINGRMYQLPAGVEQLSLRNFQPSKIISKYTLYLTDNNSNTVSELRNYTIRQTPKVNSEYFIYLNSLSGYDTIVCHGKQTHSVEVTKESFESTLPVEYSLLDKQYSQFNHSYKDVYTISTGFISKEEADRIAHELLMSTDVRVILKGKKIPIVITTSKSQVFEDDTLLYFVRFTYHIAYSNPAYSNQ